MDGRGPLAANAASEAQTRHLQLQGPVCGCNSGGKVLESTHPSPGYTIYCLACTDTYIFHITHHPLYPSWGNSIEGGEYVWCM